MYVADPTLDLRDMHCYLASNHTLDVVTIGRTIPELWLSETYRHSTRGMRNLPGSPSPEMSRIRLQSIFVELIYPLVKMGWKSDA